MFTRSSWAPCALCILIFASGCDLLGDQTFTPEPVVSAVLTAGEPLVPIRLAETGPIGEFYDAEARSINNATVRVNRLAPNGQVDVSYEYEAAGSGWYTPVQPDTVTPGATYALEIQAPDFPGTIRAVTTVPQSFEIVHPPESVVVYQDGPSPGFGISPPTGTGREAVFVLKVEALDPDVDNLTPFAADLVADRDVDPEDLITANSPILNESSFTVNPDGTLQVSVVWLAFNFYGPQE
ncbi:MAG: DUF4249 family protein, partial [Rubricoccaceae bacterium]|nr:DUF4249 family protein [Rubricoccaceae bacterium]